MQSDSMSDGQDISLQGAYRQDQGAKLEVKPTDFVSLETLMEIGLVAGVYMIFIRKNNKKWWR